ncbi:hypothetical protein EUGRSUZ_A00854 [Eucalyptus grandis]|uniref:Late embryogenesis abundant protein LEA-2 subgroup domain-containing protein n=2 Tax=Eucalyptus grandis TaxID=71139 RepID=A0A059DDL2_EUCGR|nr:hypothetical protein EUGRSUZ_A00854 [Eucalyptus grandis]
MEEASAPPMPDEQPKEGKRRHKRRNICIAVLVVAVILFLVILILALTVFKAKRPVITVKSMNLTDLGVSVDMAQMRALLNMTVGADISVRNPNVAGVKYTDSFALLGYRGETVGDAPIPAGRISAYSTEAMNIAVAVMADRLVSNPQVFADVMAGVLPLTANTKISGKVSLLSVFKIHVTSAVSCDINVFFSNRTIDYHQCTYDTKL